jgi:hypothetical protein
MLKGFKLSKLQIINFSINTILILIPFSSIIDNKVIANQLPIRFNLIIFNLALILTFSLIVKINWELAKNQNKILVILLFLLPIYSFIISLLINSPTSYLYLKAFSNELLPLLILILMYLFQQQFNNNVDKNKYFLIISILLNNVIFIYNNQMINNSSTSSNQLGILNIVYIVILYTYLIKSHGNTKLSLKLLIGLLATLTLIISPIISIFLLLGIVLVIIKNSKPYFNATKYIVTGSIIITVGLGLFTNLSGLNTANYKENMIKNIQLITQNPVKTIFGYGLGNTGFVGYFRYGDSYNKFLERPLISKSNLSENKDMIPQVHNWLIQLILNGGLLYAIGIMIVFAVITMHNNKNSYLLFIYCLVFLLSLIFDPFSYLSLYYVVAFSGIFINS